MSITLYIPYYKAEKTIHQCLEGVAKQTLQPDGVIVINDGSPSIPELEAEVISHEYNKGLAAARNTALNNCHTRYIAALDADVVPEPEWLEILYHEITQSLAAGVAGRMDEAIQETIGDRWRAVHMCQHWGDKRVIDPRFLYGANTLFDAELLKKHQYDERCRTNNEDRTLCDILRNNGHNLIYTPKARCKHLRRDSVATILQGYWKWHHVKGIMEGDFKTFEQCVSRLERVNFGIFAYRYDLDSQHHELRGLDLLIPWIFSVMDLDMLNRTIGSNYYFPLIALKGMIDDSLYIFLNTVLAPQFKNSKSVPDSYITKFKELLIKYKWQTKLAESRDAVNSVLQEWAKL